MEMKEKFFQNLRVWGRRAGVENFPLETEESFRGLVQKAKALGLDPEGMKAPLTLVAGKVLHSLGHRIDIDAMAKAVGYIVRSHCYSKDGHEAAVREAVLFMLPHEQALVVSSLAEKMISAREEESRRNANSLAGQILAKVRGK